MHLWSWILVNALCLQSVLGQETGSQETLPVNQQPRSIPPGAYDALVFANLTTPTLCPGTENSGKR